MDKLRKHWDTKVTLNHKHFVDHMPMKKVADHINRVRSHVLSQIDLDEVKTALDWGCGGGLLAKELSQHFDVTLVDISEASLTEAQRFIGKECKTIHVGNPEDVEVEDKIDLILCYSVIQHFPSYEYWVKVSQKWRELSPKHIAIQIKLADKVVESKNYFAARNYLNGLHLGRKQIKEALPEHKITYWKESIAPASGQKIAFIVLTA
tara:strand:+ start:63412 stop:64032 length:621 start_codon:yes stop_codon:yes gene_type:complete